MTPGMEEAESEPRECLDLQYDHTLENILTLHVFKDAVNQTLCPPVLLGP